MGLESMFNTVCNYGIYFLRTSPIQFWRTNLRFSLHPKNFSALNIYKTSQDTNFYGAMNTIRQ